jgi:glycosyltransferase involved in cell wall biosynthesis
VTLDHREAGIAKGWLDHRQIPERDFHKYLSIADILVQPGEPNAFNRYRFPSKLPMFLASGRPVIMPEISVSCLPRDGMDCLLLREGSQEELMGKIRHLARSPALRKTIGEQGRRYAAEHFSWRRSAEELLAFYQELLRH